MHLHLSVSDGACQVWGGHLEPGALVGKGTDLLVGVLAVEGSGIAPSMQTERAPAAEAVAGKASVGVAKMASLPSVSPNPAPLSNQEPRVEIAVLAGCPYSARALRMLRTLGIAYRVVPASGGGSFPQVRIDGVEIGGYDALADRHGRGNWKRFATADAAPTDPAARRSGCNRVTRGNLAITCRGRDRAPGWPGCGPAETHTKTAGRCIGATASCSPPAPPGVPQRAGNRWEEPA